MWNVSQFRYDERADRVGIPAAYLSSGIDDDRLSGGQVADAQKVERAEILVSAAAVEQSRGRDRCVRWYGSHRKQDVGSGFQPMRRSGTGSTQAGIVLVTVHDQLGPNRRYAR